MTKINKYLGGKIYSLSSYSRPDLVYVGSTFKTLNQRLNGHISQFNSFNRGKVKTNYSSFEIIKLGDYHIDLIENFPCENRIQLHARETYFIKTMVCVNKMVSYRTDEEKKQEHLRCNREHKKKYNQITNICDCGQEFVRNYKSMHLKSVFHKNYLKSLVPSNEIQDISIS